MVNDLGVDPDEWFKKDEHVTPEPAWENPLDSMPVANGSNRYASPERLAELESESKSKREDTNWFTDEEDGQDYEGTKEKTMHQKMYEIATAKYNPFAVGGSESLGGGSEEAHK